MDERRRYTLHELAKTTNMSVDFWRKRVWRGELEVERFGRSIRVTQESLAAYMNQRVRPIGRKPDVSQECAA